MKHWPRGGPVATLPPDARKCSAFPDALLPCRSFAPEDWGGAHSFNIFRKARGLPRTVRQSRSFELFLEAFELLPQLSHLRFETRDFAFEFGNAIRLAGTSGGFAWLVSLESSIAGNLS
jgi:hypothetical protein